jgi:N5-(cytidine 5'-diphosphoramidyl)-L-glutamine hydrolase
MAARKRAWRVGVTMRETRAQGYHELRDALSRDWPTFLAAALPEVAWVPVPNIGPSVERFAMSWNLDGLVLTGGDDVGQSKDRDLTEATLLELFMRRRRPVLGVCRGFQFIQSHLGGRLARVSAKAHVGRRHTVEVLADTTPVACRHGRTTVNSFHGIGIRQSDLAPPLQAFAVTFDGYVEGAIISESGVLGVMWHPERERRLKALDRALVRWLFGY